jgi:DnaJ-class molecular chaperone
MRDLYKTLGVPRDADDKQIRRAYRVVAKEHHPDMTSRPDSKRFRDVCEAYEVLRDPDRRRRYDRELRQAEEPGSMGYRDTPEADPWPDFGFQSSVFGGAARFWETEPEPGDDLEAELILSPEEASFGCTVPLSVPLSESCPFCGALAQRGFRTFCPVCGGAGNVRRDRRVHLTIPPGTDHGTRADIPLRHFGGGAGSLVITVLVDPDA